ncbi:hypothetical protein ACX6XY_29645, partial [Streptomyces sp. O3]
MAAGDSRTGDRPRTVDREDALVRICDLAGRPRGTAFAADDHGTLITSHEAVDGLTGLVLHGPDGRTGVVADDAVTPLPEADLALVRAEGLGVRPLPVTLRAGLATGGYVRIAACGWRAARVLGTGTPVTYTATDRSHLVPAAVELAIGTDGSDALRLGGGAAGGPVLDVETGAVLAVLGTALAAGHRTAAGFAVPLREAAAACPDGPLARLLRRNAATVPAYGRDLNLAGALHLTATSVGSDGPRDAAGGPSGPGPLPVERPDVVRAFADFLASPAYVIALVGDPGTGRTTELAALAGRRARGVEPAPTVWLRGAGLRADDASIADAVARALQDAGRIIAASADHGGPGGPSGAGAEGLGGVEGLGDIGPDRVARLARDAGRPLLLLLDCPEEMPPALAHRLAEWTAGTVDWLRDTGVRLVVACGPAYWEQAGAYFPPGFLHTVDGPGFVHAVNAPGRLPAVNAPGRLPADDGPGRPASDGPGFLRADGGSGGPAGDGPGFLHADGGSGGRPASGGSGFLCAGDGSGRPACDGPGFPRAGDGPGWLPARDGSGRQPADDGPGCPPTCGGAGFSRAGDGSGRQPASDGSGFLPAADGPARLPACVWLADLPEPQAARARARFGVPDGAVAPEVAAHPLALRLLSEVRAALPETAEGRPGRAEIFTAYLDLVCLRVAVRLAAPLRLRGTAVRRLAAKVSGQLHEAARCSLGPGQGELDRDAFEALFPWATGWASAVLTEGVLVPAGAGYRFAHEELADWMQGAHLDLDAALRALVHRRRTDIAPTGAPVRPQAIAVPRHRVGPVVQALLLLARQGSVARLSRHLEDLIHAADHFASHTALAPDPTLTPTAARPPAPTPAMGRAPAQAQVSTSSPAPAPAPASASASAPAPEQGLAPEPLRSGEGVRRSWRPPEWAAPAERATGRHNGTLAAEDAQPLRAASGAEGTRDVSAGPGGRGVSAEPTGAGTPVGGDARVMGAPPVTAAPPPGGAWGGGLKKKTTPPDPTG